MSIGPLDAVTIQVREFDAAVSWYTEKLGLEVVVLEADDRFCLLGTGGAMLGLASDHPEYSQGRSENRIAPGFQVEDLEATLEKLRASGVRVDPVIDGGEENYRLARIFDPEGNRLHLYCYTTGPEAVEEGS